jgi:hypothetical protein
VDKTSEILEPAHDAADALDSTSGAQPAANDWDLTAGVLGNAGPNLETPAPPIGAETRGTSARASSWPGGLSEWDDVSGAKDESGKAKTPVMGEHEALGQLSDKDSMVGQSPSIGEAPAWLNADTSKASRSQTGAAAEPVPESHSAIDLPDWLAGLEETEAGSAAEDGESDELPTWLHPEPERPPATALPTQPADWQPAEAAESFGAVTSGVPTAVGDHRAPEEAASRGATVLPRTESESPALASVAARPKATPAEVSGTAAQPLGGAKSELGRGNIAAALDIYDKLIRRGKSLEEIIRDLRDALYRYPVEVPIWQALGDAYMRANRLQEALDAYTKAEELLR